MMVGKRIFLFAFMACFLGSGGTSSAQSLGELAIGGSTIGAGAIFANRSRGNMEENAVINQLKSLGFSEAEKDPSTPNQYFVKEPNGNSFTITMEPTTGNILSVLPR